MRREFDMLAPDVPSFNDIVLRMERVVNAVYTTIMMASNTSEDGEIVCNMAVISIFATYKEWRLA